LLGRFHPVKMITAEIKFETEDPKTILDAIKPDKDEASRFSVEALSDKNGVLFKIKADDVAALKAALNSYLRLVQVAQGLEEKQND